MQTSRERLVGIAVILVLLAALGGVIWHKVAPSGQPTASATARTSSPSGYHTTYRFALEMPASTPTWHPGETVHLRWLPVQDGKETYSSDILLNALLYGPYATNAEAQQVSNTAGTSAAPNFANAPLGAQGPAVTVTNWVSQPQAYDFSMPASLAPGYYVLAGYTVSTRQHMQTLSVVHVASA